MVQSVEELLDEIERLRRVDRDYQEALALLEKVAAAGSRLTTLACGGDAPNGDVLFVSKEGWLSEHYAHQRIRWLLRCEKALQSMAEQIVSPKTTAEDMVADILQDVPKRKGRASR